MCCLRAIENSLIVVSDVVGITVVGYTGINNEPKLGRAIRQKEHHPALAETLLPSTLFLGFSQSLAGRCIGMRLFTLNEQFLLVAISADMRTM